MKKWFFSSLFIFYLTSSAYAVDLMDVYKEALENDPLFKEAYSTYMATKEAIPRARSALYPQVGIQTTVGRNVQNIKAFQTNTQQTYNSNQWTISTSQALFNYQIWAQVQQAKATVKSAQAAFNNAAQDLILRTATAYLNILFARDTLNFAEAKKRANKRQFDQAEQRFIVGLDAITSVYEAKAAYDQSVAEVIAAKNNQINQNENLRKLTNHVYDYLAPLRDSRVPLIRPEPDNVDEWINIGLKQNYKLMASKFSLQASRENIKMQSAGNWPTFSLQGNAFESYNTVDNDNFFVSSRQSQATVQVAMNFPVLQGGLTEASTRQAQYNFQSASERLESTYRDIVVDSRIAYNTIIDGISKVKADRQTIISQQNSLESTEAQFQVGTRTMVDVVNAQQRLFEAQLQLANDQYNLIKAMLQLKYLAGTLNVTDLEEVNAWLDTTRINRLVPTPKHCLAQCKPKSKQVTKTLKKLR